MHAPDHRVVFEQALCHASLLIERLLFYTRNLGLLPRTSTTHDPLGPIVISDEDVSTIVAGFRRISKTEPTRRAELLTDPLQAEIAGSRAALEQALAAPAVQGLGLVETVRALGIQGGALDAFV